LKKRRRGIPYTALKAGLLGLTRAAAKEVAHYDLNFSIALKGEGVRMKFTLGILPRGD
jgi:NAD(P)-dependent dehydrogenase (short-subunit alcohol dehydrogenase family)